MMVKTLNNLLTVSALILIIGGFVIFWDSTPTYQPQKSYRSLAPDVAEADSYMTTIKTRKFSATGQKEFVLRADRSFYFKRGDYFELSNPQIVAYNKRQDVHPWQIKALKGMVYQNGVKVVFQDDVELWQTLSSGQTNRLTTSQLTAFPEKNLVETTKRVKIVAPDGVTTGKGMKANLELQIVSLLKDVKGVYVGL